MAIAYDELMARKVQGKKVSYTDRETMLYALGIGMGRDPLDSRELPYVDEHAGLRTIPTMATVLGRTEILVNTGVDFSKVLHGEQRLLMHRPLPPSGELIVDARISAVYDKGAGKGALLIFDTHLRDARHGELYCELSGTSFARADGGFGGPAGQAAPLHEIPSRAPDLSVVIPTEPNQALLYRLSGDRNPLHSDPERARKAGFHAPILHGLCTYAIACRAVVQGVCNYDATRIRSFDVRFSSPVFPGEEIITDIWVDGDVASFRCRVATREGIVINNGKCTLASQEGRE